MNYLQQIIKRKYINHNIISDRKNMNKIYIFVCLISFISLGLGKKTCQSDQLELQYLPEPLRVIGKASSSMKAEQVVINFTIDTLSNEASVSLARNSKIANEAISHFKNIGLEENEFKTLGLQVFSSYTTFHDNQTGEYKQIFEGYRVKNHLTICTQKLILAGKLIDVAVKYGITQVDSITFQPLPENVILLKEKLLVQAVADARKQADIMLEQLDYQIVSLKSIAQIENNQRYEIPKAAPTAAEGQPINTQIFASSQIQSVQVQASFIIAPKSKML